MHRVAAGPVVRRTATKGERVHPSLYHFGQVSTFVMGCLVGSFLNVCIYRLPRGRSIASPLRSYCPSCHEPIAWYDNVPIISYALLHGQCRKCGSLISPRYWIIELLTGGVFLLVFSMLVARPESLGVVLVYLALAAALIVSTATDLELRIIPDEVSVGGMVLAPIASVVVPSLHANPYFGRSFVWFQNDGFWGPLAASLLGMAVGAGLIYGTGVLGKVVFRKDAMGLGDVKLMAMIGGLLGWKLVIVVFLMSPIFGAVVGLLQLLITGDHHIAYGPFISLATFITMLWGDRIVWRIEPLFQVWSLIFG